MLQGSASSVRSVHSLLSSAHTIKFDCDKRNLFLFAMKTDIQSHRFIVVAAVVIIIA